MTRTLHITNGTSIIPTIQNAGIEGAIVPWNDVLHEGPVPTGLGPVALREIRAAFLAGCGWGSFQDILRDLEKRDSTLDNERLDEIVLWFEHDLYDQLQLIQILDRLPVDGHVRLTAVVTGTYLGQLSTTDYPALFENRRVVTSVEQLAARDAWQAFRSPDPSEILTALPRVTALPHLAPALQRHLEQFPWSTNGLSRTEQQTLEAVASGVTKVADVYVKANHDREEAMFMGDAGFLFHISALFNSSRPLLRTLEDGNAGTIEPWNPDTLQRSIALTPDGERVLTGRLDRVAHCGIDRWLGGVHLSSASGSPIWRWDRERHTVRIV